MSLSDSQQRRPQRQSVFSSADPAYIDNEGHEEVTSPPDSFPLLIRLLLDAFLLTVLLFLSERREQRPVAAAADTRHGGAAEQALAGRLLALRLPPPPPRFRVCARSPRDQSLQPRRPAQHRSLHQSHWRGQLQPGCVCPVPEANRSGGAHGDVLAVLRGGWRHQRAVGVGVVVAAAYPSQPDDEGVYPYPHHLSRCRQRLVLLDRTLLLGRGLCGRRGAAVPVCHVGTGQVFLVCLLLRSGRLPACPKSVDLPVPFQVLRVLHQGLSWAVGVPPLGPFDDQVSETKCRGVNGADESPLQSPLL
ncbi:hypothetical protein BHE74_00021649 [Ensete ventricosum]|nr:hypothetical protein BHE74_00021649 [Ensete ventricosum]